MTNKIAVTQRETSGTFATAKDDVWELRKNGEKIVSTTALADGVFRVGAQFLYELDADSLTDAQKLALVNNAQFEHVQKVN